MTVPLVELGGAEMLAGVEHEPRGRGVASGLAHDIGQVRDILRRAESDLGRMYTTVDEAIGDLGGDRDRQNGGGDR